MNFLIGLFIGMGLSQKNKHRHSGGVVFLQPVGNHSTNPFDKQDTYVQKKPEAKSQTEHEHETNSVRTGE